jgi:hypothetical protein
LAVFGARSVSSAISKLPQLVSTTAVASSPCFSVCLGADSETFRGFGASTCSQPSALAVVLEPPSSSPPREIRITATIATASSAKAARTIQRRSACSSIGAQD